MKKAAKKTRGRPPSDSSMRSVIPATRITDEEKDLLAKAAAADRRPLTQWVRVVCVDAARKQLGLPPLRPDASAT